MLKIIVFSVLSTMAFSAGAFFRPPPETAEGFFTRPGERVETQAGKADFTCAINIRYNIATPTALEINYVGGNCSATAENAMLSAPIPPSVAASKLDGEPALAPVYQCGIMVHYDPAAPSGAQVQYTGAGCEATRRDVMLRARQAVSCMYHYPPACP